MHLDWLKGWLKERPNYKNKWWVIWYEQDTKHCAGMEEFKTEKAAVAWDKKNPPRKINEGNFDKSEVYSSYA